MKRLAFRSYPMVVALALGLGSPSAFATDPTSFFNSKQFGTWTTGRTWTLLNSTDSVNAVQSGTWTTGRTWTLSNGTDSIAAVQSGTWNINNISGTITLPTGASTSANQTTEIAALQIIDNLPHANDSALNNGVPIMGQLDDVSTTTVTENNVSTVRITPARALHTQIRGGSTAVAIGNRLDRLKVDEGFEGSKVRIIDMNVASGGVARATGIASTTVYTTIFDYLGTGHIFSFLVALEGNLIGADPFNVKFEVDGVIVLEINTADVGTNTIYNLLNGNGLDESVMGMSINTNVFRFVAPRAGMYYTSEVKVSVKKASGGSKQFHAGMIYMTKE